MPGCHYFVLSYQDEIRIHLLLNKSVYRMQWQNPYCSKLYQLGLQQDPSDSLAQVSAQTNLYRWISPSQFKAQTDLYRRILFIAQADMLIKEDDGNTDLRCSNKCYADEAHAALVNNSIYLSKECS